MTTIDRSEVSRQLAKAIAYKQCGKDADAAEWARRLVIVLGSAQDSGLRPDPTLECAEILK